LTSGHTHTHNIVWQCIRYQNLSGKKFTVLWIKANADYIAVAARFKTNGDNYRTVTRKTVQTLKETEGRI